ncbi:hypothetical protein [Vibrio aphrogenes]|uniref:hypothetical protein n=1 Tax=Vibrio aphrogenes TaxID=1891186 RepID=UPI000B35209F|nr:hypothetical protein [Vibrio aphrogenes]
MLSQIEQLVSNKNQWLINQVDVEFPTPESIAGRDIYLQLQATQLFNTTASHEFSDAQWVDEVIEVDFHRLTIMFSLLQATQWEEGSDEQKLVIEFLTQIILDSEYQLYLGFIAGEPVAALISKVLPDENTILFTDIVVSRAFKEQDKELAFAADVLHKLAAEKLTVNHIIHPV